MSDQFSLAELLLLYHYMIVILMFIVECSEFGKCFMRKLYYKCFEALFSIQCPCYSNVDFQRKYGKTHFIFREINGIANRK